MFRPPPRTMADSGETKTTAMSRTDSSVSSAAPAVARPASSSLRAAITRSPTHGTRSRRATRFRAASAAENSVSADRTWTKADSTSKTLTEAMADSTALRPVLACAKAVAVTAPT